MPKNNKRTADIKPRVIQPIIAYLDDSEESRTVVKELREAGLDFRATYTGARVLPSVQTGLGIFEGILEIRSYCIPSPRGRSVEHSAVYRSRHPE